MNAEKLHRTTIPTRHSKQPQTKSKAFFDFFVDFFVVFVGFLFDFPFPPPHKVIMEELGLPAESVSMEVDSILQKKDEKEEGYEVSYERMKELQRELEFIDIQVTLHL